MMWVQASRQIGVADLEKDVVPPACICWCLCKWVCERVGLRHFSAFF